MTHFYNRDCIHPAVHMHAAEVAAGQLSRREFLVRATALGVSAATAYALIGATPAKAQGAPQMGGTIRIQQDVRAMKDPPTYDWPQISNLTRGFLEYLVQYNADGTFEPRLAESWEVNEDATRYIFRLRPGATWNDGRGPLTAADVAYNFARWCDGTMEGNSMAAGMGALQNADGTGPADGAIEIIDDMTVQLNLSRPDITIIPTISGYQAPIVPEGWSGNPADDPVGTGPYRLTDYEVGVRAVLEKDPDHPWWGEGAYIDRIEFIDYGTDGAAQVAAAEADEIDMTYEVVGEFVDIFEAIGWNISESSTANTLVLRTNQVAEVDGMQPYADVRVRRALALAADNSVLLDLGYSNRGTVAENHHVHPIHPEYADIGPAPYDPELALSLLEEAGMADYEHELISIDDDWRRNTSDALAAQLRDAGIAVRRTVLPGSTFWNDWQGYPFSSTDWGHRPLGIQNLILAYTSTGTWNETGVASEELDQLLIEAATIADADARSEVMVRIQTIVRDEIGLIQPYWRSLYRASRPGVVGADSHPINEIHVHKLGLEA